MTTRITDRQVTAEELIRLPRGQFRYELVKGELRRMTPAGFNHGAIVVNVTIPLAQHVKAHALGVVCGAETGFRIHLVWVVNAQRLAVTIHRAGTASRTLSDTAMLTGDDVVAGFQMLVADIFAVT